MKTDDVYKLAPATVPADLLELARSFSMPQCDTNEEQEGYAKENAESLLEVAQRYYRLGAFDMEHKDGARCEGSPEGHPCEHAAEFFVLAKHLPDMWGKRPVYCAECRMSGLYHPPIYMAPIYENPAKADTASESRCVVCGEYKLVCCNTRGPTPKFPAHVDPHCADCCNHKD
jgi:hypothetical protein